MSLSLAMLAEVWSSIRSGFKVSREVSETAKDASSAIHDLQDARKHLPGNRGKARRAPNCRLKAVRFLASLNSQVPTIQVNVEITNFENKPVRLFVTSVDYLHPSRGQPIYRIESFVSDVIPGPGSKSLPVARALYPHEIVALGKVPDRPAVSASVSVMALVNFKDRDHVIPSSLNEQVDGRIEGDPLYQVLAQDEWDLLCRRMLPALPWDQDQHGVMTFMRPDDKTEREGPLELVVAATHIDVGRARDALELLCVRGLLYKNTNSGRVIYAVTAAGREYQPPKS
jgi:hypothetical protein